MLKTNLNRIFLGILFFLALLQSVHSQEATGASLPLIDYIEELENQFQIKFSFVDEDLRSLKIIRPVEEDLPGILQEIRRQTQLTIKQLNDRYYTVFKSTTVDICGKVLDNYMTLGIPGASVEVLGSSLAMITDSQGEFTFTNIPRNAVIRIRHLGYKVKYITAEDLINKPCTRIPLGLRYQQLEEVVVSQFLTTGIKLEDDGSISIQQEEFGILPGLIEPDVLQTIQALPGIKSIDERVSDINIRGGTNDQNLILWDGIKMYQSGHFFGLISAFNPYLTDNINIIKNGTSAQYGEGVSGIISMESRNHLTQKAYGGAGFNLISGDAYAQIPLTNELAVQFSARRSVTDFLNTPTYSQFFDRAFQDSEVIGGQSASNIPINREESFYFYDFTGKVLYNPSPDHKIRFNFININNNLDYEEESLDTGLRNSSTLDQTNISFGGSLESSWSNRFQTRFNAYYTEYNLEAQNSSDGGVQELFQNNRVVETAVKASGSYQWKPNWGWQGGYQFTEVGVTNFTDVTQPPFNSNIKGVIRTHVLYSEGIHQSENGRLKAIAGVRAHYIENLNTFSEIIIEPRININYKLSEDWQAQLLGEFKNQTTNQVIDLEQNFLGVEKRRWIVSNTTTDTLVNGSPNERPLPIVRSKQASLGLNYDKGRWFVGLEGFYKYVDGISTDTQGFQNEDQFNGEIGEYSVMGLEFLINHKNRYFSTWLSYTFNENEYTFNNIDPNTFPNNLDIRHTVSFATTYMYRDFKLGVGINYRTGRPYTEPLEGAAGIDTSVFPFTIAYQSPNSSTLPDYFRTDLSALYDFNIGSRVRATAGASVLNVLNRRNVLNTYYRLNRQNEIETVESISLGLTPNISFRVSF
ncbi:TonB-dependent receptor [Flavobacteriaceae bacterium D16]|nr:TonB-dependent receptor [Flavobacteriaceae bacterium D16]